MQAQGIGRCLLHSYSASLFSAKDFTCDWVLPGWVGSSALSSPEMMEELTTATHWTAWKSSVKPCGLITHWAGGGNGDYHKGSRSVSSSEVALIVTTHGGMLILLPNLNISTVAGFPHHRWHDSNAVPCSLFQKILRGILYTEEVENTVMGSQ